MAGATGIFSFIQASQNTHVQATKDTVKTIYDIVHVLNFLAIHFIDVVAEVFTIYFLTVTITVKKSADVFIKLVS